jgi:hypothetical protein
MVEPSDATQHSAVRCLAIVGERLGGNKGVHVGEHRVLHRASSVEMPSMAYGVFRREHRMRRIRPHDPKKFSL